MSRGWFPCLVISSCLFLVGGVSAAPPATVAEAAKNFDLRTFPLAPKAETPPSQTLANLSYNAPGNVANLTKYHQAALAKQGWKELPGSTISEAYASATFEKQGYRLALSAFPQGDLVSLSLQQLGNVDLKTVPAPAGAKVLSSFPITQLYVSDAKPEAALAECIKVLTAKGWQPYGSAGPMHTFKQHAVLLQLLISDAPAQPGKTMINYTSSLMSADLPAPPDAQMLQYADTTTTISFETALDAAGLQKFYQSALSKEGWQATTDHFLKVDFREELILRNPAKDLIEIQLTKVDEKYQVLVKHQTAKVVAEIEARAKAAAMKAAAAGKSAPKTQVAITLPAEAKDVQTKPTNIEFKTAGGKAKSLVVDWQKAFTKDGWKEEVATLDDMAGTVALKKGDLSLTFTYIDTGFLPAEISIQLIGGEFATTTAKK
ncbi:hypothetical protein GC163_11235 [bacterium]|nr:hypothetical protein [bacterium]